MTSRFAIFVFSLFALAICTVEGVESQTEGNTWTNNQIERVDGFQSNARSDSNQDDSKPTKDDYKTWIRLLWGCPIDGDDFCMDGITYLGWLRLGFDKYKNLEDKERKDKKEQPACHSPLGCFDMGKPWKTALRPVKAPQSPTKIGARIFFYSKSNSDTPIVVTLHPKPDLNKAPFAPSKMTAIIVHGFANSGNSEWIKDLKKAYLKQVDANIMVVDWGKGAQHLNYLQVAGNTRVVGKQLVLFLMYLIKEYGAVPVRFHLIGHCVGAHVCSYLAKDVPGISRITALDPAQPCFEGFDKKVRLDSSDAGFVDVIHTDARPFLPLLGFGMIHPVGHVDFYVNGGFNQPGCHARPMRESPKIKCFQDLEKYDVEVIDKTVNCPHSRAYKYLTEAYNDTECTFWGQKRGSSNLITLDSNFWTQDVNKRFLALTKNCTKKECIPLGPDTKKSSLRGPAYVLTNEEAPYCKCNLETTTKNP